MGIPVYVNPPSPKAAPAAEKTTSLPTIRRQRTVRGPQARLSAESRRRRMLGMGVDLDPRDYNSRPSPPTGSADHARSFSPGHRHRRPTPGDSEEHNAMQTERSMQRYNRLQQERANSLRLRAFAPDESFERQYSPPSLADYRARNRTTEPDGPLMPPVPELRDTRARDRARFVPEPRAWMRRLHAPTPPDAENMESAPATQNTDVAIDSGVTTTLSPESIQYPRRRYYGDPNSARTRDISLLSQQVQEVNRLSENHRRRRQARLDARVDGLGDRDRSLSPDLAWDTLLTSITPDPQPPSAGSSFASASASAAASGPVSANTSMTSLSPDEDFGQLYDCEFPVSDSDNDEDMLDLVPSRGDRSDRFWSTYTDVVTSRADQVARTTTGDTEHLGGMHRIISRLAERDDIPESWWAGAGLRREPTI